MFSDLLELWKLPFRHFHENNKGAQLTRITVKANQSEHLVSVVSHDRPGRYGQTVFIQMIAYINKPLSLSLSNVFNSLDVQ